MDEEESPGIFRVGDEQQSNKIVVVAEEENKLCEEEEAVVESPENPPPQQFELLPHVNDTEMIREKEEEEDSMAVVSEMVDELVGENPSTFVLDNNTNDDSKVVEFASPQVDEITPSHVDDSEVVEKLTPSDVQESVDSEIVENPPSEVVVQQLVDSEKVEDRLPETIQESVDLEVTESSSLKIIESSSHVVEEMVDSEIVENPTLCVVDDSKLTENLSRPLVVEDMIGDSDVVGNSSNTALNPTVVGEDVNDESQLIVTSEVVAAEMGDSLENLEEMDDTQILGNPPVVAEDIGVSDTAGDSVEINDMELVGGVGAGGQVDNSRIVGDSSVIPEKDGLVLVGDSSIIPGNSDLGGGSPVIPKEGDSEMKGGSLVNTDIEDTKLVGGSPVTTDIEDTNLVGGAPVLPNMDDSELAGGSPVVEESVAEEATPLDEMDMEETDIAEESGKGTPKRKRGRAAKGPAKLVTRKKIEEDVCFICFDGGNLVLCDRRGCMKAYHPACVNRDEAFFRTKGRWNCGWHICSNCEKAAQYMCFTCTYSLCKACIKEAEFSCVRGNKGFCQTCLKTVMLVEKNEQGVYDDKNSWEFLFKDYWLDLKRNLSLTLDELTQTKNSSKSPGVSARKEESSDEVYNLNTGQRSDSDGGSGRLQVAATPKKRKSKRKSKLSTKEDVSSSAAGSDGHSMVGENEWASKELLEFVAHMKNGNTSILSQFDVQALLLDYIKKNDLRDPRRKSQIVCDTRLKSLFGKERVGHFEMLKLLESHFLLNEDAQADDQDGNVDTKASQLDAEGSNEASTKAWTDRRRKRNKKSEKGPQSNVDDYAAIDVHNINLVYLKRNLMEDLLKDMDSFEDTVVGSFVRIRITGAGQKQDMYRLVQVVGIGRGKPYQVGKQKTEVMLEILNLNKTEEESIDRISSQDFSEDECKRLRQSIKCGLIGRLTVGDIQDKAIALQTARVNDWLEAEKLRLNHLRDRASDLGKRKELRECVEKLQLLNKPEERFRRLQEIPEVHADPNMDPSHESEEEEEPEQDVRKRDNYLRSREAGYSRKGREPISPGTVGSKSHDAWSGSRKGSSTTWEPSRNTSTRVSWDRKGGMNGTNETSPNQGRDAQISRNQADSDTWSAQAVVSSEPSQTTATSLSTGATTSSSASEAEKIWKYKDPSGKDQGPFSMVQLRKWSTTGYFPAGLKVWRNTENPEDSISLTDALNGKFEKDLPQWDNNFSTPQTARSGSGSGSGSDVTRMNNVGSVWNGNSSLHIVKPAEASNLSERTDYQNLPTPTLSTVGGSWSSAGWSGQTPTQGVIGVQQSGKSMKEPVEWSGHSPTPVVGEQSFGVVSASISPSDSVKPTAGGENCLTVRSNSVEMQGVVVSAANPSITTWNPSGNVYNNKAPEENQVWRSADSAHQIPNIMINSRHGGLQSQGWVAPAQLQDLPTPTPTTPATQVINYPNPGFPVSNSVLQQQQQQQQFTSWSLTPPNTQSGNSWGTAPNMQQQPSPVPPNPNMQQLASMPHTLLPPPPLVHLQQSPLVANNQGWPPQPANANMGWGGSVQGSAYMGGWVAPQAQPQGSNNGSLQQWGGNTNDGGWCPPPAANNMSESRQKHDGRYSGHWDRGGYHGGRGDSNQSSGGRQSWNRQPSFGGGNEGSSGQKGPRMCKYYESGDCRRGADCEYRHH